MAGFQSEGYRVFRCGKKAKMAKREDLRLWKYLQSKGQTRGGRADCPVLSAETPAVTIVGKSWRLHVEQILGVSIEENVRMIRESVAYLKSRGREVLFDAEHFFDGYKDDSRRPWRHSRQRSRVEST